jgi:hypothetical protein
MKFAINAFSMNLEKGVAIYLGTMGLLGFKRGFCGEYSNRSVFHWNKEGRVLYTDKIGVGLAFSMFYINPVFYLPIFMSMVRRTEKRIRGMPIKDEDWDY